MNNNNKCFPLLILITLVPLASPVFINPNPIQPFHPTSSPRVNITIPAQSDTSSPGECPLDLPTQFFTSVKSACTRKHKTVDPLKCCPVLAAWLYSAYSATALGKQQQTASYYNNGYDEHELPLLPNDSESCVQNVENRLKSRGIELMRSNESCDVVYCECGIRLHHPLTCTESFSVNSAGDLIGNHRVKMLEKNCLNNNNMNMNSAAANAVCSKCLKTLHLLKKVDNVNTSKVEERTSKMHNEDCELMGLTWLLAKNRSAYIHTVSAVLRATMMSTAVNTIPESCTLNSDGMPLAVDSSEINDSSSSASIFNLSLTLSLFSVCMFCMSIHRLFDIM